MFQTPWQPSRSERSFRRAGRWSWPRSAVPRRSGRKRWRSRCSRRSSATTRSGSTTTSTTCRVPAHEAMFECWTVMAAISQRTSRIRLGQMVGCAPVPQPGAARQDHQHGRRDQRRTPRLGHRRRLVRARVPGLRLRVRGRQGPHRDAARDGRDREGDVVRARRQLRRPLLPTARRAVRSEAGAAAAPADLDRWRRRAAHAARRRPPRRLLELRRQAPRVGAQGRGAEAALQGRRSRLRRDQEDHGQARCSSARPKQELVDAGHAGRCGASRSSRGGRATSSARPTRSPRRSRPTSTSAAPASCRGAPTIPTPSRCALLAEKVIPNFR